MTKKKKWIMIFSSVAAVILLAILLIPGYFMSGYAMEVNPRSMERGRQLTEERYGLDWYDEMEKTDYTVEGDGGYILHVQYIKNPAETEKYVIISHGYTDNRYGALKYAPIYLEAGFNVIVYDLRAHGLNEKDVCTFSARERKDLYALIEDSRSRHPGAEALGLHGESLGAATSIAVLEYKPEVDFVVADCGFADIEPVFGVSLKAMKLPAFIAGMASPWAKLRYGYSFDEMRPIDSLEGNEIPILFIHGGDDDFILPEHSVRMKEATLGYSELHIIPGAVHARSLMTAPEEYEKIVDDFIGRVERGDI